MVIISFHSLLLLLVFPIYTWVHGGLKTEWQGHQWAPVSPALLPLFPVPGAASPHHGKGAFGKTVITGGA